MSLELDTGMTLFLIALGVAAALLLALAVVRWLATRNLEGVLTDETEDAQHLPALPKGHRPPPGVGPISPSERALAAEVQRGLRDLQVFLLDAA